ncbi:MAG: hypothetical protein ACMUIP_11680 [bacterium]
MRILTPYYAMARGNHFYGHVRLMMSGLAREIVLIDRNQDKAAGECMDLNHGLSFAQPAKIYSSG